MSGFPHIVCLHNGTVLLPASTSRFLLWRTNSPDLEAFKKALDTGNPVYAALANSNTVMTESCQITSPSLPSLSSLAA
jgi:hypothetical protein